MPSALYAGISNYGPKETAAAARILRDLGTPCLIHQQCYNMFNRGMENGLLDVLDQNGMGCIVFSPLAQGLLTDRYLGGIPADSRAGRGGPFLRPDAVTPAYLEKAKRLNAMADKRGQTLAQMATAWILRLAGVTSVLIGASKVKQIEDIAAALDRLPFDAAELAQIDAILAG